MIDSKICRQYGHSWRFEKTAGRRLRICNNCGEKQTLLIEGDEFLWQPKEGSE